MSLTEVPGSTAAAVYILGWYLFSTAISVYNKWMFGDGLDFKFPILITAFHQSCLAVIAGVVLWWNPHLRPIHARSSFRQLFYIEPSVYVKQIVPCSIASAADIGLSNASLKFLTLSLYTMLKTSSLVFVLIFGLLFRLEKFNWRLVVIVAIMTVSVAMMGAPNGDPAPPQERALAMVYESLSSLVPRADAEFGSKNHIVGIFLVLFASMSSGLRWSLTQILLKRNQNPYTTSSFATIFYVSPAMSLVLLVSGLIIEGWSNFTSSQVWELKGLFMTLVLLVIPGLFAFMMTYCEFMLLKVAQVLTLSIAGLFKEVLTIVVSALTFGDRLSGLNIAGLVLTLADVAWYNIFRHGANAEEPPTLAFVDEESRPSEDDAPRPIEMRRMSAVAPSQ
ncbi:hypothetical protein DICA1_E20362 [Diutina catenulata]